MDLLDELLQEFPALDPTRVRRVIDPFTSRVNAQVPGQIQYALDATGIQIEGQAGLSNFPFKQVSLQLFNNAPGKGPTAIDNKQFTKINLAGFALVFPNDLNVYGMRLDFRINGNEFRNVGPGSRLPGPFSAFEAKLSATSVIIPQTVQGVSTTFSLPDARLVVEEIANSRYEEISDAPRFDLLQDIFTTFGSNGDYFAFNLMAYNNVIIECASQSVAASGPSLYYKELDSSVQSGASASNVITTLTCSGDLSVAPACVRVAVGLGFTAGNINGGGAGTRAICGNWKPVFGCWGFSGTLASLAARVRVYGVRQ